MNGADALERRAEAARWLAIADQDLAAARVCLGASPPLAAVAAYHCQQAAEKIAKALLVAAGTSFPKTHDLAALDALAAPLYPALAAALASIEPITVWGTAYSADVRGRPGRPSACHFATRSRTTRSRT